MSVTIYISNKLEDLVDKVHLSEQDPLSPSVFITQTDGIKHWLSLQLAKREGVFTNFRFFKPNSFINEVAFTLRTGNPKAYNNDNLRWWIYALLIDKDFLKRFPFVASYYEDDDLKRIQLAFKVADLFDQYIVYRTEMVEQWSLTDYVPAELEKWQCWLWREIKSRIESVDKEAIDKAKYKRVIHEKLHESTSHDRLKAKYPVIHLFGLSIMTKFHLELYQAFSEYIDVRFYLLNPAPEVYWYDCLSEKEIARKWSQRLNRKEVEEYSVGNTLLTSWGKVGQELFSEIFEIDDSFINSLEVSSQREEGNTLLAQLQNDIHENVLIANVDPISIDKIQDRSLQIAGNYTVIREVEALYDYLLHTIDKTYKAEDIEPQDIVVMVPNIREYIPYIKTVFENAPKKLPFSIGDEPVENVYTISNLIIKILGITEQDFTAENVLELLEFEELRKKYGIKDVSAIRRAVRDTTIRFGIEGDQKSETHLLSWKNGLRKIVLGIAMRDHVFQDQDHLLDPYQEAEGSVVEDLLRFVSFVEELIKLVKIAYQERSLGDWVNFILRISETFVDENYKNEEEFNSLRNQLEELLDSNEHFKELKLTFEVFFFMFKEFHLNETKSEGYFRGRITFCTALPMRSIPFKIIAFLGLNSEDFPRKSTQQGFDIIQNGKRRRGDRNMKENDRYLFLEAFLSAKDHLYLSYLSKGVKTNSEKNPSILIDELLDYISKRSGLTLAVIKKSLFIQHPLHSYSPRYLQSNTGLYTYFPINETQQKVLSHVDKELEVMNHKEIDFNKFINFFKQPIKHYLQNNIGVYYNDDELVIRDEEVLELEIGLHAHKVRNVLFDVDEVFLKDVLQEQKRKGQIPLANFGELLLTKEYWDVVQPLVEKVESVVGDQKPEHQCLELLIGEHLIRGEMLLYGERLVNHSFSNGLSKYKLELYLQFLFLRALGSEEDVCLFAKDTDCTIQANTLTPEEAKTELGRYLEIYLQYQDQVLLFTPELAEAVRSKNTRGKFDLKTCLEQENGVTHLDEYLKIAHLHFPDWDQDEVEKWSNELYMPAYEACKK